MSSKGRAKDRQPDDFYETPAWATDAILPHLNLTGLIFEPAAGHGAIATQLMKRGVPPFQLLLNDLDPGRAALCQERTGVQTFASNFLTENFGWSGCCDLVITNPPYSLAQECILRSRTALTTMGEVAMLLRLNFLSGLKRIEFWRTNPADVFVLPKRPSYCVILRDIFRCVRCKREWKVPHEAGPFFVPADDQCDCGEIPIFKKTVKTANDSCEYAWFCFGPTRGYRWSILELPAVVAKPKPRSKGANGYAAFA